MICQLAKHTDIRAALVVGGLSLTQQAAELRQAPEIVVATPGRIIDHIMNTMAFELDTLSALILDEADRLLEMGFQDEVLVYSRCCLHFVPHACILPIPSLTCPVASIYTCENSRRRPRKQQKTVGKFGRGRESSGMPQ
jgi:hypothetical protein